MVGEERVMPTAQEDVEEKQEGVLACPMAMMDAACAGSCCHLLWRCSEGKEAPGESWNNSLASAVSPGPTRHAEGFGLSFSSIFAPSSLWMSPVSWRALISPSQVLWGVWKLQSSPYKHMGWRTHPGQVQRRAMWSVWKWTDALWLHRVNRVLAYTAWRNLSKA